MGAHPSNLEVTFAFKAAGAGEMTVSLAYMTVERALRRPRAASGTSWAERCVSGALQSDMSGVTTMGGRAWHATAGTATALLVIVVAAAMMFSGCGSSADAAKGTLKLTQTDEGKTFALKVGDTIQVIIPGNPTTGYEWTAALSQKEAALIQEVGKASYAPDNTDESLVGSGGVYTFTFKALAQGQALLKLAYARSFDSVQPIQTYSVTLTIE